MLASRRGREFLPISQASVTNVSEASRKQIQAMTSAKHALEEYLAQFTHDRAPKTLVAALDIIKKATTIADLVPLELHESKFVRDAVGDEIRVMQGLAPNSETSQLYYGRNAGLSAQRMSILQGNQRQTRLESPDELFRLRDHGLTSKVGTVSESYTPFTHDLNQKVDNREVVKQSQGY